MSTCVFCVPVERPITSYINCRAAGCAGREAEGRSEYIEKIETAKHLNTKLESRYGPARGVAAVLTFMMCSRGRASLAG